MFSSVTQPPPPPPPPRRGPPPPRRGPPLPRRGPPPPPRRGPPRKLRIDLKWPEMRSKVICAHPKWPTAAILSKI